jgi:hypothetical protein
MKMVIFTQNHGGYKEGAGQLFDETIADNLIQGGFAKEFKTKEPDMHENIDNGTPSDEELKEREAKAVVIPQKDKMIHRPKHKK